MSAFKIVIAIFTIVGALAVQAQHIPSGPVRGFFIDAEQSRGTIEQIIAEVTLPAVRFGQACRVSTEQKGEVGEWLENYRFNVYLVPVNCTDEQISLAALHFESVFHEMGFGAMPHPTPRPSIRGEG